MAKAQTKIYIYIYI